MTLPLLRSGRLSRRPSITPLLAVSALSMSVPLIGCTRIPAPRAATPASRPDPVEALETPEEPEPAKKRSVTKSDTSNWSSLPGEAPTGPLQAVYEETSETLWRLSKKWGVEADRPTPDRQRRQVAKALAPLIGLLRETWTRALEERPELRDFEQALERRAEHTRMPAVDGATALGWFLVETAIDRTGSKVRGHHARWTLNALRWSTSSEELYTTAFDALSPKFATVPDEMPKTGPWRHQAAAVAAVTAALEGMPRQAADGFGTTPPDGTGVFGVRVAQEGRVGHASLSRATALDQGSAFGSGNAQLDGSESVRLSFEFKRAGAPGTLFSESLFPVAIPDCAVVEEHEAEFPEVPKYGVAPVGITVLASGRCHGEQKVRLAARSSNGEATEIAVTLAPRGEPSVAFSLRPDGDSPGSSGEHDSTKGLLPGARLELLPTLSAPSASELEVRELGLAFDGDDGIATFEAPRFGLTRTAAGVFAFDDDADLKLAPAKDVREVVERRDQGTVFGADPAGLWLTSEIVSHRAGAVEPALPVREKQAEFWIGEHLPAGVDRDALLGKIADAASQSVSSVGKAFGDVEFLEPSAARTRDAFTRLLKQDLLREAELKVLLGRFELPNTVLAEVVASQVEKTGASSGAVAILLAHLDARVAQSAGAAKGIERSDDTARGIGIRVATSSGAAKELERSAAPAPATSEAAKVPVADRKVARNLVIAELATASLDAKVARRVLDQLGFLELDIKEAQNAVRRAVTVGLLMNAFKLETAPDAVTAGALTEFVAQFSGKGANAKTAESARRLPVGAVLVRRWTRLLIAVDAVGARGEDNEEEAAADATPEPAPASPRPAKRAAQRQDDGPPPEPAKPSLAELPSPPASEPPSDASCALAFGPRVGGMGPMAYGTVGAVLRPPSLCDLEAAITVGYQQTLAEAFRFSEGSTKPTGRAAVASTAIPIMLGGRYWLGGNHALLLDGGAGLAPVVQDSGPKWGRSGVVGLANAGIGYGFRPSTDLGWRFSANAGMTFLFSALPESGPTIESTVNSLLLASFFDADTINIGPHGELAASYLF